VSNPVNEQLICRHLLLSPVLLVLVDLLADKGISEAQLLEKTGLKSLDLGATTFFNSQQADEICRAQSCPKQKLPP